MHEVCTACGQKIAPPQQMGISPRQKEALRFIRMFIVGNGHAPTFDELSRELKITKSNAHGLVMRLADRGRIRFTPGVPRSIALVD